MKGTRAEEGAGVRVFEVRQFDALQQMCEGVHSQTQYCEKCSGLLEKADLRYHQEKNSNRNSVENMRYRLKMTACYGRVIVPAVFRDQILAELHQDHAGVVKMMDSAIENVASLVRHAMKQSRVQLSTVGFGEVGHAWQRVHMDCS